jgi:cell division septation protein DedD
MTASVGVVLLTGTVAAILPDRGFADATKGSPQIARPSAESGSSPAEPSPPLAELDSNGGEGAWRIQIGAFRRSGAAELHLERMRARLPELDDLELHTERAGPLTRAQFGDIKDEGAASRLCRNVSELGSECMVVRPRE